MVALAITYQLFKKKIHNSLISLSFQANIEIFNVNDEQDHLTLLNAAFLFWFFRYLQVS